MPGLDGTGPHRQGPFTGRGLGICRESIGRIAGTRRITLPFISAVVMSAAVSDIRNPNGLLRRATAYLGGVMKKVLPGAGPARKNIESFNGTSLEEPLKQLNRKE